MIAPVITPTTRAVQINTTRAVPYPIFGKNLTPMVAATTPATAIWEPTEISIPPKMIGKLSPAAKSAFTHICDNKLMIFILEKKLGFATPKNIHNKTRKTTIIFFEII